MVIELSFQNSRRITRRVQITTEFLCIEEMMRRGFKTLMELIESEREATEIFTGIKDLDI